MNRQQFLRVISLGLAVLIPFGIVSSHPAMAQRRNRPINNPTNNPTNTQTQNLNNVIVSQHNTYRAAHSSPSLTLSTTLTASAQAWADSMAASGNFAHSTTGNGENLYVSYTTASSVDPATLANNATTSWYNEKNFYDWNNPGNSTDPNEAIGHFTQMVWQSTTEIGCATAQGVTTINGTQFNAFYVVCQYSPPGNVGGQYGANVLQ